MKNQGSSVSQDGARCEGSQNGGPGRRHVQWAQMTSSFAGTIPLAGLIDLSFSRDINAEAVASVATSLHHHRIRTSECLLNGVRLGSTIIAQVVIHGNHLSISFT